MDRLSLRDNRLKFKTSEKLPIIPEESINIYFTLINKKPKDNNMSPVGLGNTRILTGYAQKSLRTLAIAE